MQIVRRNGESFFLFCTRDTVKKRLVDRCREKSPHMFIVLLIFRNAETSPFHRALQRHHWLFGIIFSEHKKYRRRHREIIYSRKHAYFRTFYERSSCSTMLETTLHYSPLAQKYKNQRKRWLTFGNDMGNTTTCRLSSISGRARLIN